MAQDLPLFEMPPIQEPDDPASDSLALAGDNRSIVTDVALPLPPCRSVIDINSGELSILSTKPRYLGRGSERRFANMILPTRFAGPYRFGVGFLLPEVRVGSYDMGTGDRSGLPPGMEGGRRPTGIPGGRGFESWGSILALFSSESPGIDPPSCGHPGPLRLSPGGYVCCSGSPRCR